MIRGWPDFLRTVILGEAIGVIILVVDLLFKYFAVTSERSWRSKKVPMGIPLITCGVLCLIVHTASYTFNKMGYEVTYRTWLGLCGFSLLLIGVFLKRNELSNELDRRK